MKDITISIPAYNDSKSLQILINECCEICRSLQLDFQILVINDGSHDDTLHLLENLTISYKELKFLHHENNRGFGATLKEVFTLPDSRWIVFLPGDNQFPAKNIERFVLLREKFDFIIGYRKKRNDNLKRKFYSYIYNILVSFISGYEVNDVNSIVCFKKDILSSFQFNSTSAFIHAELFIKASQNKVSLIEVEVLHQKRNFGFGAGGSIKVIVPVIIDLLKFYFKK